MYISSEKTCILSFAQKRNYEKLNNPQTRLPQFYNGDSMISTLLRKKIKAERFAENHLSDSEMDG